MADKKISELASVTTAGILNVIPIVVDGVTKKINASDLKLEGQRRAEHNIVNVSATSTINLSTQVSVNVIVVGQAGLFLTVQFPTNPLDAQVCQFTTLTNTVTIIAGSGNFNPVYAGAPTAGYRSTYVYHDTDNTWYLIG